MGRAVSAHYSSVLVKPGTAMPVAADNAAWLPDLKFRLALPTSDEVIGF
jgi:hypothetical protein